MILFMKLFMIMIHVPQATEKAKEHLKAVLGFLDQYLKTRTFLVGERLSLADISVGCQLLALYKQVSTQTSAVRFTHPMFMTVLLLILSKFCLIHASIMST